MKNNILLYNIGVGIVIGTILLFVLAVGYKLGVAKVEDAKVSLWLSYNQDNVALQRLDSHTMETIYTAEIKPNQTVGKSIEITIGQL